MRISAVLILSSALRLGFLMSTRQHRWSQFRPFLSRYPVNSGFLRSAVLTSLHFNCRTNGSILVPEINAVLLVLVEEFTCMAELISPVLKFPIKKCQSIFTVTTYC